MKKKQKKNRNLSQLHPKLSSTDISSNLQTIYFIPEDIKAWLVD